MKVANKKNLQSYRRGSEILGLIEKGFENNDTEHRILGDIDYMLRGRGVLHYEFDYLGARVQRSLSVPFICLSARDILFFHREKFRICNKKKELNNYMLTWV